METFNFINKNSEKVLCSICDCTEGKYTCPRCLVNYCSLACYKQEKHAQCSEKFYQQCVQDELASLDTDNEAKLKMMELLKNLKVQNEEEPDEINYDSDDTGATEEDNITERLHGIDLDDPDTVWGRLNESEKRDFLDKVNSGQIREILPVVDLWWVSGENTPTLASDIPCLATFTSKAPSPALPYLIMNTVVAYQLTFRLWRGQTSTMVVEAATSIWLLSSALRSTTCLPCSSVDDAVNLVIADCLNYSWIEKPIDRVQLTKDLQDLTTIDSCFLLLALSHIRAVIDDVLPLATTKWERFTGPPPKTSDLKKASKKLMFYLAWAKQFGILEWDTLVGK